MPRNGESARNGQEGKTRGYQKIVDWRPDDLDAEDFVLGGDGDYVLGTETFSVSNTGAASVFGITGDAGSRVLQCTTDGTATNDSGSIETAPMFEVAMGSRTALGPITTLFAFIQFTGTLLTDQVLYLCQAPGVRHGAFLENDGLGIKLGAKLDYSAQSKDPSPVTVSSPKWLGAAFQTASGVPFGGPGVIPEDPSDLSPARLASWSIVGAIGSYPNPGNGPLRVSFCPVTTSVLNLSITRLVIAELRP